MQISREFPLAALLGLPDTSVLAVRGRPVRAAAELKRTFLDLIDNPLGRLDFATGTPQIKSHEFYFIDRIHVDRLARRMTELLMDVLPGLASCHAPTSSAEPDTTLFADRLDAIDSNCNDDRTHKLLEFVREVELVAADAEKVERRRVPPATCAELRTLFTRWSVSSRHRIIDLRYTDWIPAPQ